jgi:hypothetical protein
MSAMYDGSALDYEGELWKCRVPSCKRKIPVVSFYCCTACYKAHQDQRIVRQHSGMCDSRNRTREDCTPREQETLRQPGTRST